jgi:hypothetical protein
MLNIYVHADTITNTKIHRNDGYSLVSQAITWTTNSICSYNTKFNIYIYFVNDVNHAYLNNESEVIENNI